MKISEILMTYKTDKASQHSYGPFYDSLFSRFDKLDSINILELGVQAGGSLLAWKDYFPNANVYGIDISDSRYDEYKQDRVTFIKGDVRDMPVPPDVKFDIIIDDSDHFIGTQKFIALHYLPLLKKTGVMVIEDVQDSVNDFLEIRNTLPDEVLIEHVDLRGVRGRYDDFLIVINA